MKVYRILWSIAVLTLALTFAGCGGGGNDGVVPPPTSPILGEVVPDSNGVTAFNQTIEAMDLDFAIPPFPGQANYWDLGTDFSLGDGGDDQFDGALQLAIDGAPFPGNQLYSELAFLTPYLSTANGVKVAAVAESSPDFPSLSGLYSAWLAGTSDSRLQRTIDLRNVSGTLILTWNDQVFADSGDIADPSNVPYYQVVVRDASTGLVLDTPLLYATSTTFNPSSAPNHTADLSAYAGQIIILSFETRGTNLIGYATVDDVSLTSNGGANLLVNGDFETGDLSGWTTNAPQELQNVTSGVRTLEGLNVTRSFYTVPNRLWGRWVDVFENPGVTPITVSVTYTTDLGHDNGTPGAGTGMIAYTPGTTGALSSWDNLAGDRDRDLGLVFGRAEAVLFDAPSAIGLADGDDLITVTYNLTVPALGRRALVNFVVMNGIDTGEISSVTASTRPVEIDAENMKILSGYGTDPQYQEGMTQEQIEAVVNF
ncbi:hypothetical protein DSOUD_2916 [Desulfuromonas soudanensis]|uniref:Uncharacterized protein n=1 Tax=Desulfuromonas soudanensis TaxID=1603606 RepID=A0A0M5ILJ0_9BACT|nr:hypothetical protein [Desulfuromonas soudanensis]ALC17644.1 hypothetical protein DSOUD_2916 [Desulfuromonas soudanensis]